MDAVGIRFNNDSGAHYDSSTIHHLMGTVAGATDIAAAEGRMRYFTGNSGPNAAVFGPGMIEIPNYAAAGSEWGTYTYFASTNASGGNDCGGGQGGGTWRDASAITRIQLFGISAANFKAGSRLTIYGES